MTPSSLSVGVFYRDALRPGGVPHQTLQLCDSLSKRVRRLVLYTYLSKDEEYSDDAQVAFQVSSHVGSFGYGINAFSLPQTLKTTLRGNEDNLDVLLLIGSFVAENAPIARLARRSRIPYVVSVQDSLSPVLWVGTRGLKKRLFHAAFERRVLNGAALLRIYSNEVRHHLALQGHSCANRCFVAKEGIDREFLASCERNRNLAPGARSSLSKEGSFRFGFLGRLDIFQKGLDVLLQGWRLYTTSGGTGTLELVGPADERTLPVLLDMASTSGPGLNIREPLYGDQKVSFLRSLNLFVHPSRHEGVPRSVLEALGARCPVLVTTGTNLHDIVHECAVGYVTDLFPEAIADALHQAHLEWSNGRDFSEGMTRAHNLLSWDKVAEDVLLGLGKAIDTESL